MKVYIAGPMRGYDQFNFPAFDRAAAELRHWGVEVISPAEVDRELGFDETLNDLALFEKLGGIEAAMHRDFGAILECDGIVLLPGWEASTGARAELFVAEFTGRTAFYYVAPTVALSEYPLVEAGKFGLAPPAAVARVDESIARGVTQAENGALTSLGSFVQYVEERSVDPTTGGEKGVKLARFDLLPAGPILALAEHFGRGAEKYEERNWEKGYAWSKSFAAMMRHAWLFWSGHDIDHETGSPHLIAVAWHALAMVEWATTHPDLDDRPT